MLCGPANSGKIADVMSRLEQSMAAGRPCWLVVPTSADVVRARAELLHRTGAAVGVDIGTFHQLTSWLGGPLDGRVLTPPGVRMHVGRILRRSHRLPESLHEYPGFVATANEAIHSIREARVVEDIFPGEAPSKFIAAGGVAAVLGRMFPDERALWMGCAAACDAAFEADKLFDDVRVAARAVCQLREPAVQMPDVFLYGFDDISPLQLGILQMLARRTNVTMSVPFEPGRVVFERRQVLIEALEHSGARVTIPSQRIQPDSELAHLADRFCEPTAQPLVGPPATIRCVESCGELGEIEDVLHAVAQLVSEGHALHDIACVTADPSGSRALIEACCARYGIPCVVETPRTLADVPAGRAMLDLVAARHASDTHALLRLIRSGYVDVSDGDQLAHELHPWLADPELEHHAAHPDVRLAGLPESIAAMVAPAGDDGADPCAQFRAAVEQFRITTRGDRRLIRSVDRAIQDLQRTAGKRPITWDELSDALTAIVVPPRHDRPAGHLLFAPITRVRTDRCAAVVMFGLHSGSFSAGGVDEADRIMQARELAYVAVTRPTSSLYFIRQASGSDGRPIAPHPVWLELRRLVPDARIDQRRLSDVLHPAVSFEREHELWEAFLRGNDSMEGMVHPWDTPVDVEPPLLGTTVSVTDVEAWAQCPARWFIDRRLVRRDDVPTHRQVLGMLVHDVLAHLVPEHAQVRSDSGERVAIADRATIAAELARARKRLRRGTPVRDVDMVAAQIIIERILRHEPVHGSRIWTEQSFADPNSPIRTVILDDITLTGVIDRCDVTDSGDITLHDYKLKSSWGTPGKHLVRDGWIQMLLYWHAVESTPGLQPVAALYRPLTGSKVRGVVDAELAPAYDNLISTDRMSPAAIDQLVADAVELARDAITGMRAGQVPPRPRGGNCPDWCTHGTICRIGERA